MSLNKAQYLELVRSQFAAKVAEDKSLSTKAWTRSTDRLVQCYADAIDLIRIITGDYSSVPDPEKVTLVAQRISDAWYEGALEAVQRVETRLRPK